MRVVAHLGTFVTVACPLWVIWRLHLGQSPASNAVLALLCWRLARWDLVSYYLRYAELFCLCAVVVGRWRDPHFILLVLAITLTFLGFFLIVDRRPRSSRLVKLEFPLRHGVYGILHGGSTFITNQHWIAPAQRYALDIVKLNRLGIRARGILPADRSRYKIFGEMVYSPCDGVVTTAVDRLPDLLPGQMDRNNLAGNHIVIRIQPNLYVCLAHLLQGSIAVGLGEKVTVGMAVARVGNSGNTSEPHLHIHVKRGGSPESALDGEGVPSEFGGRWLTRGSLVC